MPIGSLPLSEVSKLRTMVVSSLPQNKKPSEINLKAFCGIGQDKNQWFNYS
jgi:hypothetical protein